jgi:predicted pyridoxine 5'-phosphate oxidase superfamily flavin-nucleotide-binding protein
MGYEFGELMFTPAVREVQERLGSRQFYARREANPGTAVALGERERAFVRARDSMYVASVSETGWPYVQHRGGPVGFVKVLGSRTLAFADYSGNRQYVTTGHLSRNDRVALILVDYGARARLKILGHARVVEPDDGAGLEELRDRSYRARVERGIVIDVVAFDWNCPQHITPRYSVDEYAAVLEPLRAEIRRLGGNVDPAAV